MKYLVVYRWFHCDDEEDYTVPLGVFDVFESAWEFAISYCRDRLCSLDDIEVGYFDKNAKLGEIFNED